MAIAGASPRRERLKRQGLSRQVGCRGLWEVRSALSGGRIARVMFCIVNDGMVLLHAFIRKSRRTAKSDLILARRRQKEIES
ncbi:MAG: type II toxin-antitoxin system RelE/ParE family toxin [Dongiaceae bacterium]